MLNDILLTVEKGDVEDIRKVCEKYISRYKSDDELFVICNRLLFEKDVGPAVVSELREGLVFLAEKRKTGSSKKKSLW
ncbi:MAG: hypothetical protein WAX07_03670 [Candidatus Altiarchaeia archaeon]|jgi:hypothetical protein